MDPGSIPAFFFFQRLFFSKVRLADIFAVNIDAMRSLQRDAKKILLHGACRFGGVNGRRGMAVRSGRAPR
jgi:hypothetical protein